MLLFLLGALQPVGCGMGGSSSQYYASWYCTGSQCAAVMGGMSGTAGPFSTAAECEAWRQAYILTSTCSQGSPQAGPPPPTVTVPSAPTGVIVDAVARVNWPNVSGATSYNVYWAPAPGVTTSNGTRAAGVVSPYVVTGLAPGGTYCFVVTALNSAGESSVSNEVCQRQPLAALQPQAWAIAVDDLSVYWLNLGGTLNKTPKAGGAVTPLFTGGTFNGQSDLAIDATFAYFTDNTSVWKVALDGTSQVQIATGLTTPRGIALDATDVYWAEYGYTSVKKVSKAGGAITVLMSDFPNSNSNPQAIAVDSTYAYWTEFFTGSVKRVGINGGTTTTFAAGPVPFNYNNASESIAVDATSVYWTVGSRLMRASLAGVASTLATSTGYPVRIALDADFVYFTDSGYGVRKVPVGGGAVTQIATAGLAPHGIAVDATHVYWVESNTHDGSVNKAPK
jgi:hypothetical protein